MLWKVFIKSLPLGKYKYFVKKKRSIV